jgi:hypothetical protein
MAKKELDHEKFKNVAAGVQSWVVALGLLIGGIWTLYLYTALNTKQMALAEFEEMRRKNHQGVVTIDVKAEQEYMPDDPGKSVRINIQATNLGDRNIPLKLGDAPLTVSKLHPDNDGRLHIEWAKSSSIPYLNHDSLAVRDLRSNDVVEPVEFELLRAGQTVSFPTWFHVEGAGLYLIEFAPELTGEELRIAQQAAGRPNDKFHVTGQTFILVK